MEIDKKEQMILKGIIPIFMIAATMCGLIGFYFGTEIATNECNSLHNEFFSTHQCFEGNSLNNPMEYTMPNFNFTRDMNDK